MDPTAASADSVELKAAKKQAAKDAAEGQKLLKKKSFAEAVPKLESAYAADPKPATLRALAEAQAGAGHADRGLPLVREAAADATPTR